MEKDFMCIRAHFPNSLCGDMECKLPFLCIKAELQTHSAWHILVLESKSRIKKGWTSMPLSCMNCRTSQFSQIIFSGDLRLGPDIAFCIIGPNCLSSHRIIPQPTLVIVIIGLSQEISSKFHCPPTSGHRVSVRNIQTDS